MLTLAAVFLALSITEKEFVVTWFFEVHSCGVCHERQIMTMTRFYEDGDMIVVNNSESDANKPDALLENIKRKFPDAEIKTTREKRPIATGFQIYDTFTGELFKYETRSGSYNISRTNYLLALFRDP